MHYQLGYFRYIYATLTRIYYLSNHFLENSRSSSFSLKEDRMFNIAGHLSDLWLENSLSLGVEWEEMGK